MSLNLSKSEKIDLTKDNPIAVVCLAGGWDPQLHDPSEEFDLDIFATGYDKDNNVVGVTYFGDKSGLSGCTIDGDNRTGEGDGDDETIETVLASIPAEAETIVFSINIFQGAAKGQHFGRVKDAFVRLYDKADGKELAKFDLTEDHGGKDAIVAGKMYRHNGEWKFQAIGESLIGDINEVNTAIPAILAKY